MKKFVAYFDILGYKNRINDKSIDEELAIQEDLITGKKLIAEKSKNIIECSSWHFSDTHILYTNDFGRIIQASLKFMVYASVRGFPMRGAIEYGDFYVDENKNIIIGKALREAYEFEKQQNWMGCALTNRCYEQMEGTSIFNVYLENKTLVEYDIPFKKSTFKKGYAINMMSFYTTYCGKIDPKNDITKTENIKRLFSETENNITPDVNEKLINTINFYDYIKKRK